MTIQVKNDASEPADRTGLNFHNKTSKTIKLTMKIHSKISETHFLHFPTVEDKNLITEVGLESGLISARAHQRYAPMR